MKYVLLLAGFLFTCTCAGQSSEIRYSEPFEIHDHLASRLVICGNGNTLLFNFKRNALAVDVYDTSRRLVRQEAVPESLFAARALASSRVCAVFTAGSEVLLFLQVANREKTPQLLRLAFDSQTGALRTSEPVPLPGGEQAAGPEAARRLTYAVRHDPASGAYAVACHTEYPGRGDHPVWVCRFDNRHRETGRTALASGAGAVYFRDMIVHDSDVWITSSTGSRSGDGSTFEYDARLTRLRGSDTSSVVLKQWRALEPVRIMPGFSGKDRSLRLAMHAETDSLARRRGQRDFEALLASVDAEQLAINYIRPIAFDAVRAYRRSQFGLSLPFSGIATDIFVDGAGGTEVLFREMGGGMTYDLAVLQFDAAGTPGAAFSARRANPAPGVASVARIRRGELDLQAAGSGEMAFDYLRMSSDRIVIYNDHPANLHRDQRAVPKILQHPPAAQTTASSARRGRWHLFNSGAEDEARGNRFADFHSGAWNGLTSTYAVLITERSGMVKRRRIAWLRF